MKKNFRILALTALLATSASAFAADYKIARKASTLSLIFVSSI